VDCVRLDCGSLIKVLDAGSIDLIAGGTSLSGAVAFGSAPT